MTYCNCGGMKRILQIPIEYQIKVSNNKVSNNEER